jgi:tetratricopeptide (TPR) repeat protein
MHNGRHLAGRIGLVALFVAVAGTTARATDDLTQGLEYFKSGKYAEAAARFQVMVDSSPKYAFGYHMLGLSYLQLGRPKEAEVSLLKAIEIDGTKFQYHHGLARSYLARRDSAKAIATLKTAEPLATTNEQKFPLYSLRGFAYATLEKWPEAVDDLEKARAIQPQAAVLVQLGRAYMHLGYAERAAPAFRQAAQANSSDAATNEGLAEALLDMAAQAEGKRTKDALYGEALQIADRVLKLQPNEYQSYNLVGRAALGAQDYARAEQSFRKVLAQRPDHCYAMTNLGKTYMAQERWVEAETTFANATVCAPRLFVALESLGHAQQMQAKLPQAIQSYEMAQEIKASDAVARAIATCKQDLERHGVPEGPTPVAEIETKKRFEEAVRKAKESGFKRQPEP